MRTRLIATASVAVALATALPAAYGIQGGDPGISDHEIKLGATFPLSGAASSYASIAYGMDAYFKYIDSLGGVNGRKITFLIDDDAYNPAQTVQQTRALVERDRVFAIVGSLGTENNLAIRGYLNQRKVPHVLITSGAATWGLDGAKYPYSIGWQPDYQSEGAIYARYLLKAKPGAKIGVIYQNDSYGKDYLTGFSNALGAKKSQIVDQEGYEITEPDVQAQIAKLKSSGADVLMLFTTPRFTTQSFIAASKLGWKPLTFVNSVSATDAIMTAASNQAGAAQTEGALSINSLKDPANPRWANDSGMKLYRTILAKYGPKGANANDIFFLFGMAKAQTFTQMLLKLGQQPTRAGLLALLTNLHVKLNPFLLPGISIDTSKSDRFLVQQAKLFRYTGGTFVEFGSLINARP